jgi:hypothetical protein
MQHARPQTVAANAMAAFAIADHEVAAGLLE